MILTANNNGNYGGTLITQKYSPLEQIITDANDKSAYVSLFNQRITALSAPGAFPKKLTLVGVWPAAINVNQAPMVVISSTRAQWVKGLLDNQVTHGANTGYLDNTTFSSGAVPWYSPARSGRPVFFVVHHTEYGYYRQQLSGYQDVYVVGWRYGSGKPAVVGPNLPQPAGFGASRFAALEMVKNMGYHMAWAVDDNVVNVNGFPNTPATIEADLTPQIWGIGFAAATTNKTETDLYTGSATFATKAFTFTDQKPGLLQQVVLWNVDLLRTNSKNMSPYFVASNEDVSFSNYLQKNNYDERIIKALSIVKIQPTGDDNRNAGAALYAQQRSDLTNYFYQLEKDTQIQKGTNPAVNLSDFVRNTILPNSQIQNGSVPVAQSQAVEQVLAKVTDNGWAPAAAFDPFAGNPAMVERLNAQ